MRFRPMEMILGDAFRRRMIHTHSRWLTRALRGGAAAPRAPRIPRRRVEDGGWAELMRTDAGRAWASAWWDDILRRTD